MTNQEKFIQTFGIDVWQQMIVFFGNSRPIQRVLDKCIQ